MNQRYRKHLTVLGAAAALALAAVPAASARHGADDPVGHDVGDDHGGLVVQAPRGGADDPANHDARDDRRSRSASARHRHHHHRRHHDRNARRGHDDGPNHDVGDDRGRD